MSEDQVVVTLKTGRIFWLALMLFNAVNAWTEFRDDGSDVVFGVCTAATVICLYASTR